MFKYDVDMHFKNVGWDTYEVNAKCIDNARYITVKRVINELNNDIANDIDCIRVYKHNTDILLKEYII